MTEYLVFPVPNGLVKVTASSANVAKNKYIKEIGDYDEELIIIPASHGNKTVDGDILPLYKCNIEELYK